MRAPDPWDLLRAGKEDGLVALYHEHFDAVFGYAFRRTASVSAAEDVVQATFTALWAQARRGRLPALEEPTPLPYLFRVAGNEFHSVLRRRRRDRDLHDRLRLVEEPAVQDGMAAAVASQVDDERRMSDIRRALERLPRGQREAVELVVWSGLSMREAAVVLDVAEGTVKSRVSRARSRLGELLATPDSFEESPR